MSSRLHRSLGLFLLFSMGGLAAGAQEPLTLRQAINEALGKSPEAAIARAGSLDAIAAATMARTSFCRNSRLRKTFRAATIRSMRLERGYGRGNSRKPILR